MKDVLDRMMMDAILGGDGTATANTASDDATLTLDKIMESIRQLEALPPAPPEIRYIQSIHAVTPARPYPKRKAKNASHLRRMNNKWRKRYGNKPAMYWMEDPLWVYPVSRNRKTLVVHPALMGEVRRASTSSGSQA